MLRRHPPQARGHRIPHWPDPQVRQGAGQGDIQASGNGQSPVAGVFSNSLGREALRQMQALQWLL